MNPTFPKSPYIKTGGIVHFARMLDKIRLNEEGKLTLEYQDRLGASNGFDGFCCTFLHIDYATLAPRVKEGGSDEEILEWCFARGTKPTEHEIVVWNSFMMKICWRDFRSDRLQMRLKETGLDKIEPPIETMFDFIEVDEGRPQRRSAL